MLILAQPAVEHLHFFDFAAIGAHGLHPLGREHVEPQRIWVPDIWAEHRLWTRVLLSALAD